MSEKRKAASERWRKSNPEKARLSRTASRYGLSVANLRVLESEDECAICGSITKLVIDHCHSTGSVRGRLCYRCNTLLGMAEDSIDRLRAAISYLEKDGSIHTVPQFGKVGH